MSEWQPIKTAPLDEANYTACSDNFLVWDGHITIAAWFNDWPYDGRHPEAKAKGGWVMYGGRVISPSHWMPLPEPPQ